MKVWSCKIGECDAELLPDGADAPMRAAVERAYRELTGFDAAFNFSGWGAELSEPERAVVEKREPSEEHYRAWQIQQAAPDLYEALTKARRALLAYREDDEDANILEDGWPLMDEIDAALSKVSQQQGSDATGSPQAPVAGGK